MFSVLNVHYNNLFKHIVANAIFLKGAKFCPGRFRNKKVFAIQNFCGISSKKNFCVSTTETYRYWKFPQKMCRGSCGLLFNMPFQNIKFDSAYSVSCAS